VFLTGFPTKSLYAFIFFPVRATFPARKTENIFLFLETSYPLVNRNMHLSVILRLQFLYRFKAKYRAQTMPVTNSFNQTVLLSSQTIGLYVWNIWSSLTSSGLEDALFRVVYQVAPLSLYFTGCWPSRCCSIVRRPWYRYYVDLPGVAALLGDLGIGTMLTFQVLQHC